MARPNKAAAERTYGGTISECSYRAIPDDVRARIERDARISDLGVSVHFTPGGVVINEVTGSVGELEQRGDVTGGLSF
jgi:hypothetical protein